MIKNRKAWYAWVVANQDPYGKACVDVARKVMEILDRRKKFDPHKIIDEADDKVQAGGITGFMAGCVASMVSKCHSRGKEFRERWNICNQIHNEGEEANRRKEVLNPALLTVEVKE